MREQQEHNMMFASQFITAVDLSFVDIIIEEQI